MKMTNMKKHKMKSAIRIATLTGASILLATLLSACGGSGAGGGSSSGTGSCTATGTYTVEWVFSGSHNGTTGGGISVAVAWADPSGGSGPPFGPGSSTFYDPASGSTLLTETLPACSSATINMTMLENVTLTNATVEIRVDGTVADSESYTGGPYASGTILPPSGAVTVIVGQ